MATRRIDKIVKIGNHPLEDVFNIESGTTEIVEVKSKTELSKYDLYDEKDNELENDFQNVVDAAMDVANLLKEKMETNEETKYTARLAEVYGQQLSIALNAIEKRSKMKIQKDTLHNKKPDKITNIDNRTIVMDRNAMLDAILGRTPMDDAIDVDMVDDTKQIGYDE